MMATQETEVCDDEEYEVESLKDVRGEAGAREYLVSWVGFQEADDTWEPEINLHSDDGLVAYAGYAALRYKLTGAEQRMHLGPVRHWQTAKTAHGTAGTAAQADGMACMHCPTWWPCARALRMAAVVAVIVSPPSAVGGRAGTHAAGAHWCCSVNRVCNGDGSRHAARAVHAVAKMMIPICPT